METKTAVQFIEGYLELKARYYSYNYLKLLIEKAKIIEKEQMIKFALHLHNVDMSKTGTDILIDEAEQYYNETYNKQ